MLVVLVCILLLTLGLDLLYSLFVREFAHNGNLTRVNHQMRALLCRNARI